MPGRRWIVTTVVLTALAAAVVRPVAAAEIPAPSHFLGITVGADRTLADYRQIATYFRALDAASPRVAVQVLGKTTRGEDMFMAVISSEATSRTCPA
jgi:hypothetical protein